MSTGFFVPDSDIDDAFNNEERYCTSSKRVLDDDAAAGGNHKTELTSKLEQEMC